jgi:2,4'-dihydroxyacetophenone dioxygenase
MNKLVDDKFIEFAEKLQLPERIVHTEEIPWVPFDDGTCHFKPVRFDFTTGTWTYLFKIKENKTLTRHRHTGGSVIGFNVQGHWRYARERVGSETWYVYF